jgi:hypothetical protein
MARHLKSCWHREASSTAKSGRREPAAGFSHISVAGRDRPEYWLHVAIQSTATLRALDSFLRATWLECCGHLSAFTIGGRSYAVHPQRELGDRSMTVPLEEVLRVGTRFTYDYDFGSTTRLSLRTLPHLEAPLEDKPVRLLARNDPPLIECDGCGSPAEVICMECSWLGAWLCEGCAKTHPCGDELFLPVSNSPRTGVCGYAGPDDEWPAWLE